MNSEHSEILARSLSHIIPALGKKIIRPAEQLKGAFTPLQLHTLNLLNKKDSYIMSELAKALSMSNQQMTSLINQLEEKKLVTREHDKQDRRVVRISITKKGAARLTEHNRKITQFFVEQFSTFPDEDYEELNSTLLGLEQILDKINSDVD